MLVERRVESTYSTGDGMDVPKFPPPPPPATLTLVVTDNPELDVATPPLPVTRETSSSRRRHVRDSGERAARSTRYKCLVRNLVHPRKRIPRKRVTELHLKMTERRSNDVDLDLPHRTNGMQPVELSPKSNGTINEECEERQRIESTTKSSVTQTHPPVPYRLRILPSFKNAIESSDSPKKPSRIAKHLSFCGRLALSQFGLAWLLTLWAVAGAAAFYNTEGPQERDQASALATMQRELAINLATELRQVNIVEPAWSDTIQNYVKKHEQLLLDAVSTGYGEGGGSGGQVWTFSGCFLFAVSLLTTLGFGAPVPRTTSGRTVAVIFAAIGIPAHFLLILNLGIFLAVRLQAFATRRKMDDPENVDAVSKNEPIVPYWVKLTPFGLIGYYLLGVICFGVARIRPVAASVLFPLDFTAAGGLAMTSSFARTAYAVYLEGAVTIAAVAVAVLQVTATESLTNIGLKYDLLTNS